MKLFKSLTKAEKFSLVGMVILCVAMPIALPVLLAMVALAFITNMAHGEATL